MLLATEIVEHAAEAHAQAAPLLAHAQTIDFLRWALLLPFIGAAINGLLGARLQKAFGRQLVHAIAVGAMIGSCIVSELAFFKMLGQAPEHRFFRDQLFTMFQIGALKVDFSLAIDPLSGVMLLVVTHIGALIHIYATAYMHEEPSAWRFFAWLNLFIVSMLSLVLGSNAVVLFMGWEGVGLCSWGLIGFWWTDPAKASAALKAFVANRVGDAGLILGLGLLFWSLGGNFGGPTYKPDGERMGKVMGSSAAVQKVTHAGTVVAPTFEWAEIRNQVLDSDTGVKDALLGTKVLGIPVVALICLLLLLGATGKSAQIPLFVWLPDAMAGPTPVSALIHAATMVTAGVYLVARLGFLYALSPIALTAVSVVGALTAFIGAASALTQTDIKRVLAYSTVSQLGFMFVGVGSGAFHAGVMHLITHALFKACLFLAAGSVLMGCHHEQDMRNMGGLAKPMPITRWTTLAATWAIAGFPMAAGFYSKDEILFRAFTTGGLNAPWIPYFVWGTCALAALGTAFYMFRSYYMTFGGTYRGGHAAHGHDDHAKDAAHGHDDHAADAAHGHDDKHGHDDAHGHGGPHESPWPVTAVLSVLAFGSIFAGIWLCMPEAWTHQKPLLERFLAPSLPTYGPLHHASLAAEYGLQAFSVGLAVAGWLIARAIYGDGSLARAEVIRTRWAGLAAFLTSAFGVDAFYNSAIVKNTVRLAGHCWTFDAMVVDGLVNFAGWCGRTLAIADDALDRLLVDGAANGIGRASLALGQTVRRTQTGRLNGYLAGAAGGALVLVVLQYALR